MSDSSDTGEQLVSFFLYSLFIYPITNYIVSPHRKYPRWKAAIYAILFLATVATLHLWYENSEKGPNYYQLLQVRRDMPMSTIKKAYRSLSLELHPDKNKAPDAAEQFRKIQHAFDVITDKSKRRDYELLGEHGVKLSNQIVIDQKYLLLQLIIYYASSLIFAFLMTFSEPTGDAFQLSIFGLSSMLLVELLLILKEVDLPAKLFPYMTSHEFVNLLHRLFPAFMNGCRCITGAFFQDRKALREKAMEELHNTTKDITMKCDQLSHSMIECIQQIYQKRKEANPFLDKEGEDDPFEANDPSIGIIERVLRQKERQFQASKEGREGTVEAAMQASLKLIADPKELAKKMTMNKNSSNGWILFRNLLIYLIARFVLIKSAK